MGEIVYKILVGEHKKENETTWKNLTYMGE
jgi:hypothetical protein